MAAGDQVDVVRRSFCKRAKLLLEAESSIEGHGSVDDAREQDDLKSGGELDPSSLEKSVHWCDPVVRRTGIQSIWMIQFVLVGYPSVVAPRG